MDVPEDADSDIVKVAELEEETKLLISKIKTLEGQKIQWEQDRNSFLIQSAKQEEKISSLLVGNAKKSKFNKIAFIICLVLLVSNIVSMAFRERPECDNPVELSDLEEDTNMHLLSSDNNETLVEQHSVPEFEQLDRTAKASGDIRTITANGFSFNMVYVEGGTFTMGATSERGADAYDSEKPAHLVTLSSYAIGQTEVTQELWEAVMGGNPSRFKGPKNPVESVSYNDCEAFINKLNSLTGKSFRLPTEAEWEYAARGGKLRKGYRYSGGNTIGDVAWYDGNSGSETHPVAGKRANELGLYDMSGNVWEWCSDWFGSYSDLAQTNPKGPDGGSDRMNRGGSWRNAATSCCVSNRFINSPDSRRINLGFRLAHP